MSEETNRQDYFEDTTDAAQTSSEVTEDSTSGASSANTASDASYGASQPNTGYGYSNPYTAQPPYSNGYTSNANGAQYA